MKKALLTLVLLIFTMPILAIKPFHSYENPMMTIDHDELLEIFFKYGKNPHWSPLNCAIMSRDTRAALCLLAYGHEVDLDRRNPTMPVDGIRYVNEGKTALELAVEFRMKDVIDKLLQRGANPYLPRNVRYSLANYDYTKSITPERKTIVENKSTTAISDAIDANEVDILKIFQRNGVRFDLVCLCTPADSEDERAGHKIYYTPMQYAISKNNVDSVKFIMRTLGGSQQIAMN